MNKVTVLCMTCTLALASALHAETLEIGDDVMLEEGALSDDTLSGHRGEGSVDIDALTFNELDLDGSNHGNSVVNSVTGANFIGNSAFNGAVGMFDTIQNSGNNVLIQNATIINVTVTE